MEQPPRITFRGVRRSAGLEADILRRLKKLETYASTIIGADVLLEFAGHHHRAGNRYHVRIDLSVPGEDIHIHHGTSPRAIARAKDRPATLKQDEPDPEHRHAKVALRKAFDVARRRLQDYVRLRRRDVKAHTRGIT
jgi:ribosome-associated translation inhibitor RaiA